MRGTACGVRLFKDDHFVCAEVELVADGDLFGLDARDLAALTSPGGAGSPDGRMSVLLPARPSAMSYGVRTTYILRSRIMMSP